MLAKNSRTRRRRKRAATTLATMRYSQVVKRPQVKSLSRANATSNASCAASSASDSGVPSRLAVRHAKAKCASYSSRNAFWSPVDREQPTGRRRSFQALVALRGSACRHFGHECREPEAAFIATQHRPRLQEEPQPGASRARPGLRQALAAVQGVPELTPAPSQALGPRAPLRSPRYRRRGSKEPMTDPERAVHPLPKRAPNGPRHGDLHTALPRYRYTPRHGAAQDVS
jgi:hypothetical protein